MACLCLGDSRRLVLEACMKGVYKQLCDCPMTANTHSNSSPLFAFILLCESFKPILKTVSHRRVTQIMFILSLYKQFPFPQIFMPNSHYTNKCVLLHFAINHQVDFTGARSVTQIYGHSHPIYLCPVDTRVHTGVSSTLSIKTLSINPYVTLWPVHKRFIQVCLICMYCFFLTLWFFFFFLRLYFKILWANSSAYYDMLLILCAHI